MKYYQGVIISLVLTMFTGMWLEHVYPAYGIPLGLGMGFSFVTGYFTEKINTLTN